MGFCFKTRWKQFCKAQEYFWLLILLSKFRNVKYLSSLVLKYSTSLPSTGTHNYKYLAVVLVVPSKNNEYQFMYWYLYFFKYQYILLIFHNEELGENCLGIWKRLSIRTCAGMRKYWYSSKKVIVKVLVLGILKFFTCILNPCLNRTLLIFNLMNFFYLFDFCWLKYPIISVHAIYLRNLPSFRLSFTLFPCSTVLYFSSVTPRQLNIPNNCLSIYTRKTSIIFTEWS